MTQEPIDRSTRMAVVRELLSDATAETPRTMEGGLEQQGVVRFLHRKLEELNTEVITGD